MLPATTNPDPKYCDPGALNALYKNASYVSEIKERIDMQKHIEDIHCLKECPNSTYCFGRRQCSQLAQ